MKCSRIPN